jgi:polysaccharide export outer membrane protein
LLAVIAFALGGCYPNYPPAPAFIESFEPQFLIGPGDTVNIQVWRNPELSMNVAVRPDGKITTPLVEDLPASGRTPTQLAREIEKSLSKYVQSPVVTVIIGTGVGPYSEQIRVGRRSRTAAGTAIQGKHDIARRDDRGRRNHRFRGG